MRLPPPRGPLSSWLITHLHDTCWPLPVHRWPAKSRGATKISSWHCGAATNSTTAASTAYRPGGEWDPEVLALPRVAGATVVGLAPGQLLAGGRRASLSQLLRELVDADDGPSLAAYLQRRADHAQFREFVAPVGLPPQGGRPAHLGDPPAGRPRQGRAGRDPGRRVRRRPARPDARRAVPRHDALARTSTTPTAPTSTPSRPSRSPSTT